MPDNIEMLIRLGLACLLGGLVGLERERSRHPAGFRTHILVCVGATLVMLCNIYIFEKYKGVANVDPARLGAQVISGIGFLGAGTILKEGVTIRGLTTAASLWTVACIGIANGLGFYHGAIFATIFVLVTLVVFSKFEPILCGKRGHVILKIKSEDKPGQIGQIGVALGRLNILIEDISLERTDEAGLVIRVRVNRTKSFDEGVLIEQIKKIDGISFVEVCE